MKKKSERVPNLVLLATLCAVTALAFGLLATLSFYRSAAPIFTLCTLLFALISIAGVGLFASLMRAKTCAYQATNSENVLVEGIGRMSPGLGGMVVLATDKRVVAATAGLMRRASISASIPYQEVTKVKTYNDRLTVQGEGSSISLIKCAPVQVAALANAILDQPRVQPKHRCV